MALKNGDIVYHSELGKVKQRILRHDGVIAVIEAVEGVGRPQQVWVKNLTLAEESPALKSLMTW